MEASKRNRAIYISIMIAMLAAMSVSQLMMHDVTYFMMSADAQETDTDYELYVNGELLDERTLGPDMYYLLADKYEWDFFEMKGKRYTIELKWTNESGTHSSSEEIMIHRLDMSCKVKF